MELWICWVIVSLKINRDSLQGVSKLDNLLKVSAFQRDKLAPGQHNTRETLLTNGPSAYDADSGIYA